MNLSHLMIIMFCVSEPEQCYSIIVGPGLHVKLDCTLGRLYSRKSFIFKYKTSTLTPFVNPRVIVNLAIWNVFYVQAYVESAFMYNPGSTFQSKSTQLFIKIFRLYF